MTPLNQSSFEPMFWEQAQEAFEDGDAGRVLISVGSTGGQLAMVFDNLPALKERGIYERCLIGAYTVTRMNYAHWGRAALRYLFDAADRQKLLACGDALPAGDSWTAYRGVSGTGKKRRPAGFSWTESLDRACWFANRFDLENPAIYKTVLRRDDVYWFDNGRHEQEFIALPRYVRPLRLTADELNERSSRETEHIRAATAETFAKLKAKLSRTKSK